MDYSQEEKKTKTQIIESMKQDHYFRSIVCMHIFTQLTVDQVAGTAAFPIPPVEVYFWEFCTSVTTEQLSEDNCTSPTFLPNGLAAGGHLPQHTGHI